MNTISTISFCVAAVLIADSIFRKTDFFSPARVFLFFQAVAIGVSFLALDKKMTPFHAFTYWICFASIASFLLGTAAVKLLDVSSDRHPSRPLDLKNYNWNLHLLFACALFVFFSAGMFVAYKGIGVFPLLAKDKAKAIRTFFAYRWIASLALSYGGVVMALFFVYGFHPRRLPKIFNLGFWMALASGIVFSLALSRGGLMFFAAFAVVFYHYAIRRISMAKLFLFFAIFSTVILVTGYLKLNGFQQELQHQRGVKVKTSKIIGTALKLPYMYVANNFWNLDYALNPPNFEERHPTTYGFTALSGILGLVVFPGGGNLAQGVQNAEHFDGQFNEQSIKAKGWNTISYQWSFYKDFGVIGVFAGSFLMGALLQILYLKISRRPTMLNLGAYSYLMFFLADSCFGSFLESPVYVYGFFYTCACCYFSQRISPGVAPRIRETLDDIPAVS